MQNYISK